MISSLNHHISIVKLTVHEAYIDNLVSGAPLFDSIPGAPGPAKPKLRRTQRFDLLDEQQRVEAFRGVWGVMAYLTRDTGDDVDKSLPLTWRACKGSCKVTYISAINFHLVRELTR